MHQQSDPYQSDLRHPEEKKKAIHLTNKKWQHWNVSQEKREAEKSRGIQLLLKYSGR